MPSLPAMTTGHELEDYVAALFQSAQHYVEKNARQADVMELDVVATTYDGATSRACLTEVKGDARWGFKDLFKTLGQMHFLSIPNGLFVTTRPPRDRDLQFYADRVAAFGLRLLLVEDPTEAASAFASAGLGRVDERQLAIWRFSFWVERRLVESLRVFARAHPQAVGPREALRYYRLVREETFFISDPRTRATKLYEAFSEHPLLTLGVAREIDGQEYDAGTPGESRSLRDAIYEGRHPALQACMYIEHSARLAVMKSVIDCLCSGVMRDRIPNLVAGLPGTFLSAVRELADTPGFERFALFWQVFMWGWGGFLLDDHRSAELEALASQTGLTVSEAEAALGFYDRLFPSGQNWLRRMRTASYEFVALVPWPIMGIGAFRRLSERQARDYSALGVTGQYTQHDLINRHNSLVALLDS